MPHPTFVDVQTGHNVQAIQSGHSGILLDEHHLRHFEEGDWIVSFPMNLEGQFSRQSFSEPEFKKRFSSGKTSKINWKDHGWPY